MTDKVCGATHPTPGVDVSCEENPEPNAFTEMTPAEYDEEGLNVVTPAIPGLAVHVHKGVDANEEVHRWEG